MVVKKKLVCLLGLLGGVVAPATAQDIASRVAYLHEKALVVSNVEPTNENYADLAPLKQRLAQVTIVGLGEPIHHDGSAFKAKTRLIKFLHQELGFSVLAFESGFYDCYKAWQEIQRGETTLAAARKSLYPFWISTETEELFAYIDKQKNTAHPLRLAGLDCKFSGAYATATLLPDLQAYLQASHPAAVADTARWRVFSASLGRVVAISDYFTKPRPADTLVVNSTLRSLLTELRNPAAQPGARQSEQLFWQQFCRSTLAEVAKRFSKEQVRDKQMGDNLAFLQQQLYPDKKVIVWAAASHLTYNGAAIDSKFYHQNLRLGDYIKHGYGDQYYNIGFTGYRGEFGKLMFFHVLNVKKHDPNSIEYALGQTKQPFLFIDLRQPDLPQWLRTPLLAQPFGYKAMRMNLPLVMDGLFYSEEVFQRHSLPAAPSQVER